jgi:DNA-binding SARP family transcriptional activator
VSPQCRDGGFRFTSCHVWSTQSQAALDCGSGGRAALAESPKVAAVRFDQALDLWHGAAYAEFADEEFARPAAVRLAELRMLAEEDRAEVDLMLGQAEAAIGRLTSVVDGYPLRERAHGQLMLALYRIGLPVEAAEIYRDFSRRTRDELGLDPTPRLREVVRTFWAGSTERSRIVSTPRAPTKAPAPPVIGCMQERSTRRWV